MPRVTSVPGLAPSARNADGLLCGIDGGGSYTRVSLADAAGRVRATGAAASSNRQQVGPQAALAALDLALSHALREAGVTTDAVSAVAAGLAGIDRPEDREAISTWLATRFPGRPKALVTDVELVLEAGTPEGKGVAVVAGTGSIAFARDVDGRTARAGGWGPLLGDEGSGYAVGRAALRAVCRAADGREESTRLTEAVLAAWQLTTAPDLVARVYQGPVSPAEVATLAPVVARIAAEGDAAARRIIARATAQLADAVIVVCRSLGWSGAVPCAVGGGVLAHGVIEPSALVRAASAAGVVLEPLVVVRDSVAGAVLLARRLLADPDG